jgi:hypothetical protein
MRLRSLTTPLQDLFDGKRKFVAGAVSTLHLKASPPGTLLASLSAQLLNMRTLHGSSLFLAHPYATNRNNKK